MSADISPELKEKLRVIQMETELFWEKPQRPTFQKFAFSTSLLCLATVIVLGWQELNPGMLLLLSIFPAFSLLQYFQSKQHYEQFTQACELICYYKNLSEEKADAGQPT